MPQTVLLSLWVMITVGEDEGENHFAWVRYLTRRSGSCHEILPGEYIIYHRCHRQCSSPPAFATLPPPHSAICCFCRHLSPPAATCRHLPPPTTTCRHLPQHNATCRHLPPPAAPCHHLPPTTGTCRHLPPHNAIYRHLPLPVATCRRLPSTAGKL